mmetsp:Transcript_883/g.2046  ORF Transcript_883/g.2046 Transcript_883/m.2046 type:complete len:245 (-) Transcript_883:1023-1757(-)
MRRPSGRMKSRSKASAALAMSWAAGRPTPASAGWGSRSPKISSQCRFTRSKRSPRVSAMPTLAWSRMASASMRARSLSVMSRPIIIMQGSPSHSSVAADTSRSRHWPLTRMAERKSRTRPVSATAAARRRASLMSGHRPSSWAERSIISSRLRPVSVQKPLLAKRMQPSRMRATQIASGLARSSRSSMSAVRWCCCSARRSPVMLWLTPRQPVWRPAASNTGSPEVRVHSRRPSDIRKPLMRSR